MELLAVAWLPFLAIPTLAAVALGVINHLHGNPEAEVSEALKALQEEQAAEVTNRISTEARLEQATRQRYAYPQGKLEQNLAGMQTGLFRGADLGLPGMPGGGEREIERVASQTGVDPRELKARLDPRRVNGMSLSQRAILTNSPPTPPQQ